MHKQKPKPKKNPKKPFNKKHLFWIVPLSLAIIVGWYYLAWQATAPQRENQAQIERLNANAEQLKKVKTQLEREIPNVKESSFSKSCGQSSIKFSAGVITCGAYVSVVSNDVEKDNLSKMHYLVSRTIKQVMGYDLGSDYSVLSNEYSPGKWAGGSGLSSEGCEIMEHYSRDNFNHRYSVKIQCGGTFLKFIDGYDRRL